MGMFNPDEDEERFFGELYSRCREKENRNASMPISQISETITVPRKPTPKMLEAAFFDYMAHERQGPLKGAWNAGTMWDAMLMAWEREKAQ